MAKVKQNKRKVRHRRVRGKVSGVSQRPRLFVFKSNKHIYCGLADDTNGTILISTSNVKIGEKSNNIEAARKVGEDLAEKALKKGYKKVVFDRGGYRYHGKVKALAEGARSKGLTF